MTRSTWTTKTWQMPLAVRLDLRGWMLAGNVQYIAGRLNGEDPAEFIAQVNHRVRQLQMTGSASKSPARPRLPRTSRSASSRHSLRAFTQRGPRRAGPGRRCAYRMDVGAEDLTDANNAFGEAGFLISRRDPEGEARAVVSDDGFTRKRASRIPHAVALTGPSPPRRPAAWRSP